MLKSLGRGGDDDIRSTGQQSLQSLVVDLGREIDGCDFLCAEGRESDRGLADLAGQLSCRHQDQSGCRVAAVSIGLALENRLQNGEEVCGCLTSACLCPGC